jgi:hypothetical protein
MESFSEPDYKSRHTVQDRGFQSNQLLPVQQMYLKPNGRLFTTVLKSTSAFSLSPPPLSLSLHWLYSPCRTLASFEINFQAPLSLATFRQPLNTHFLQIIFKIAQSSISWLSIGPLSFRDILKHRLHSSFRRMNCADSGTLSTCTNHRNLPLSNF